MTAVATRDDLELRIRAAHFGWKHAQPAYLAVDTETTGLDWWDEPFCVTLAWLENGKVESHFWELGIGGDVALKELLEATPNLVFHNAKFDLQKLILAGVLDRDSLPKIHDTQALAHLLDEHRRMGLKSLAQELLHEEPYEEHEIVAWFKEKKIKKADRNYAELPREILIPYALKDVDFTIRLFDQMMPQVTDGLLDMYEMEMALTLVLLDMESRGMAVDVPYLEKTAREYAKRGLKLEVGLREQAGLDDFNPNSPKQILEAYARQGVELEGTSVDVLKTRTDPMAKDILELRKVRKIHGTYLLGLLQTQRDGLVHPWTRQFNTRTGRMASGGVDT